MPHERSPWQRVADAIENDWRAIGRPEQIEPEGDWWTVWLYLAGRGSGKTRAGSETIKQWIETGRCGRVGLIGPTAADCRDVMLEGESGLLAVCSRTERPIYHRRGAGLSGPTARSRRSTAPRRASA